MRIHKQKSNITPRNLNLAHALQRVLAHLLHLQVVLLHHAPHPSVVVAAKHFKDLALDTLGKGVRQRVRCVRDERGVVGHQLLVLVQNCLSTVKKVLALAGDVHAIEVHTRGVLAEHPLQNLEVDAADLDVHAEILRPLVGEEVWAEVKHVIGIKGFILELYALGDRPVAELLW